MLLTEEDLVVTHNLRPDIKHFSIPATRFAEELGKRLVLNIVMLGFATAVTGIVGREATRSAVKVSVPKGTEELNFAAFEKGYRVRLTEYLRHEPEKNLA